MQAKKLVSAFALVLAIGISTPYAGKAGVQPESASATGAANVKGIVRFEGTVPNAKLISMSADPSCAKQHPSPVFAQEVVTDSKGEVINQVFRPKDYTDKAGVKWKAADLAGDSMLDS